MNRFLAQNCLRSVFFLIFFGLSMSVVRMVSSGEYSGGQHFGKENWIYYDVCNMCMSLLEIVEEACSISLSFLVWTSLEIYVFDWKASIFAHWFCNQSWC